MALFRFTSKHEFMTDTWYTIVEEKCFVLIAPCSHAVLLQTSHLWDTHTHTHTHTNPPTSPTEYNEWWRITGVINADCKPVCTVILKHTYKARYGSW